MRIAAITMIEAIRNRLHGLRLFLTGWTIHLGRDPVRLPPKALIIFPLQRELIPCGLVGILTVKGTAAAGGTALLNELDRILEKVFANGLEGVGERAGDGYLGGRSVLLSLERVVLALKRNGALEDIFFSTDAEETLAGLSRRVSIFLQEEEKRIEEKAGTFSTADMERINSLLMMLKDFAWGLEKDILDGLEQVRHLARKAGDMKPAAFRKYRNVNLLLNALDRLEVRGRDSAGVQLTLGVPDGSILAGIIEMIHERGLGAQWDERTRPGDLKDGSIHVSDCNGETRTAIVGFTYKKAAVTGRLGENGGYLRERIGSDEILRIFLNDPRVSDRYLGHTRWASVGSITEENCHPINNYVAPRNGTATAGPGAAVREYPRYGKGAWTINAVLNGDIDNYSDLRAELEHEQPDSIGRNITTDTKIIPLRIERYLLKGHDFREAFRRAVNDFEGSHAIAVESNLEPDSVFLALRGSGQSLYVGMSPGQYIFASELYGLVELTSSFIKMDGERERIPGDERTRGQIFILSRDTGHGEVPIQACCYDGHPIELSEETIKRAEITTRDIDRKEYPHYLLKEIMESPLSVRKTLRGKYLISRDGRGAASVSFNLGDDILPRHLVDALRAGTIKNIRVIGQGTAAVAAAAIADSFRRYLRGLDITVEAGTSSELSGFSLDDDLSQTLVIAVTQSGTTTDTNRAAAMVKERRARLIAIVNRRQSDITHVADGVFYTSDGRDIEMSVASTKAFYAQIVAGYIMALNFSCILGVMSEERIARELSNLEVAPEKMMVLLSRSDVIRESAWKAVKKKVYWAAVGSGPNKVAADEIRIKLSELCYKTISSDIVEDKKHIDLSAEPLILVCAAGNPEPVTEDIVKDVAIFKAHAGSVVVIAADGETRFDAVADSVIPVPVSTYPTTVILNTLAGHLWGYYAACSINEDAEFFRDFRARLMRRLNEIDREGFSLFEKFADRELRRMINEFSAAFHGRRKAGEFSSMSVDTASDMTLLLKYAAGKLLLEDFWDEFEDRRPSSSPLDMLDICLGKAIDELARPIDAIRHQAKTVTVGTSRKGEMVRGILFDFLRTRGFSLENLTTREGFTLRRLQEAISEIRGYTLYHVSGIDETGTPTDASTIVIADRGGVSSTMRSRAEKPTPLMGTKKTLVKDGEIYAGLGKSDKAPVLIVPLLGEGRNVTSILLLHVAFREDLTAVEKRSALGEKYGRIKDYINECNIEWRDAYLDALPVGFLLGEGVDVVAGDILGRLDAKGEGKP
ncbi:MAG: SIS domain-containing protein [Deltaproteobacteria bacterium]|nr:SIS domain-containing protein [Deltaproteobacteria bacterium]